MKLVLVDDRIEEDFYTLFLPYVKDKGCHVTEVRARFPDTGNGFDTLAYARLLEEVKNHYIDLQPDAVLLDIALTAREQETLDRCKATRDPIPDPMSITGMKLCYDLTSEFPDVPVGLLTKYDLFDLAQRAFSVGARQYILKKTPYPESAFAALTSMTRGSAPSDSSFHEVLRRVLDSPNAWEGKTMRIACDQFYHATTPSRRFVALCGSLDPVFGRILAEPTEHVTQFLSGMVASHAILAIAQPSTRDHVRHSGNVFWMGYLLLNDLPYLQEPERLTGYFVGTYAKEEPLFDQICLAWTLASLFHDIGGAVEKRDGIVQFLKQALGGGKGDSIHIPRPDTPGIGISRLRDYLNSLGAHGRDLDHALEWILHNWGESIETKSGEKRKVVDHGVLSAERMLCALQGLVSPEKMPICLHAAAAMALHNLPALQRVYDASDLRVSVPFGLLPVCSLLGLCDTIQTWDREQDPAKIIVGDDLVDVYQKYKRAYITASEITGFRCFQIKPDNEKRQIEVDIRYFLRRGDLMELVCNSHRAGIEGWVTAGTGRLAASTFGFSERFQVKMKYWLPLVSPVEAEF